MIYEKILENFLEDIEKHLIDLQIKERKEFTTEVKAQILNEWKKCTDKTELSFLEILDKRGEPKKIAEEIFAHHKDAKKRPSIPNWLTILLTILIWPIGIIMVWLSPNWTQEEKFLAVCIPISSIVILILISISVNLIYSLDPLIVKYVTLFLIPIRIGFVFLGSPIFSGIYLIYKLKH